MGGKMLIYHGLVDTLIVATDTINYYKDMVDQTFAGSMDAQDHARSRTGMDTAGAAKPDTWDNWSRW